MNTVSKKPDGEKMAMAEWRDAAFVELMKRTPPPIKMSDDAVVCPWCGWCHEVINIGSNLCAVCGKGFVFGFPPWADVDRPMSWVFIRWEEQNLILDNLNLMPKWEPNERLKKIYESWRTWDASEEKTAITAETIH